MRIAVLLIAIVACARALGSSTARDFFTAGQQSLMTSIIQVWNSHPTECKNLDQIPGIPRLILDLKRSLSPEQSRILKDLDEPEHMLSLWGSWKQMHEHCKSCREMYERNMRHWLDQLESASVESRQLRSDLVWGGWNVGAGCCRDGACGDGVISIPLAALYAPVR